MTVNCCAAPDCGNLAEWRFMTVAHTLHVCDRHRQELEGSSDDGHVWFENLPEWAQPPAQGEAA